MTASPKTQRTVRRGPGRWRVPAAAVLAGVLGLATACTGGKPSWQGGDQDKGPGVSATVTGPAANATDVPASAEITYTINNAKTAKVELKNAAGDAVKGAPRPEGGAWVPAQPLEYGEKYTATVTATSDDGKTGTTTASFTVMDKPDKTVRVSTFLGDGMVVGVGMPLIVSFGRDIPEDKRADLQRRMFVRTTPAQEGIWHWVSPKEVHFRTKELWKAGTKFHFRVGAGGLPLGDGWYGQSDLTIDASIGPAVVMTVDNRTKKMVVTKDGKALRTIPVSLGKKSTPSSSGTMLVMEKLRKTVFDTFAELGPELGYRTNIEYAQRLTWGGEYIHSAPWSVAQQGRTNVSHGCVNMSPSNAIWLFNLTRVGDPVIVKGTEVQLKNGNGWTDWNMSWDEYVKGSAIPYEPATQPDPSPTG